MVSRKVGVPKIRLKVGGRDAVGGGLERLAAEAVALGRALEDNEAVPPGWPPAAARRVALRLYLSGPQSVPALARGLGVSRQHVQLLVNRLLRAGWVARTPNPAHRRSPLTALSEKGRECLGALEAQRRARYDRATAEIGAEEIETAWRAVSRIRRALTGPGGRS